MTRTFQIANVVADEAQQNPKLKCCPSRLAVVFAQSFEPDVRSIMEMLLDITMTSPAPRLFTRQFIRAQLISKKASNFRVTGLYAGNSPGTGEFPAQMASNAENVSIWWRHHEYRRHATYEWSTILLPIKVRLISATVILPKKRNVAHRYFRQQIGPMIRLQHIAIKLLCRGFFSLIYPTVRHKS